MGTINTAVNGYGIIGKRVAEAVILQEDMELVLSCIKKRMNNSR